MSPTLRVTLGQHSQAGRKAINQDFHGAATPTATHLREPTTVLAGALAVGVGLYFVAYPNLPEYEAPEALLDGAGRLPRIAWLSFDPDAASATAVTVSYATANGTATAGIAGGLPLLHQGVPAAAGAAPAEELARAGPAGLTDVGGTDPGHGLTTNWLMKKGGVR